MKKMLPLFLTAIARFASVLSFGMLVQFRMREMDAPLFLISSVSSVRGGVTSLSSPLWGAISDEARNRKPVLVLSLTLTALLLPLYLILRNPVFFPIIAGVVAFCAAGFEPIALAMSTDERNRRTSVSLSLLNTANSIGMGLGRFLIAALIGILGVLGTMGMFCAVAAFAVVFASFIPRVEHSRHQRRKTIEKMFSALVSKDILKRNNLWAMYIGTLLRQLGTAGTFALIAVYLTERVGLTQSQAAFLSMMNPLMQVPSHIFFGRIIKKIGSKRSTVIGASLSGLSSVLFAFAKGWETVLVGYILAGFAFGGFINGASSYIAERTPANRRAEFLGLLRSARSIGFLIGPIIAGIIAQWSFTLLYALMAGVCLVGAVIIFLVCR